MPLYTLGKSRVENLCNPPNLPIVSKIYGNFELEMGSITLNAFFLSDLNNSQQHQQEKQQQDGHLMEAPLQRSDVSTTILFEFFVSFLFFSFFCFFLFVL